MNHTGTQIRRDVIVPGLARVRDYERRERQKYGQ